MCSIGYVTIRVKLLLLPICLLTRVQILGPEHSMSMAHEELQIAEYSLCENHNINSAYVNNKYNLRRQFGLGP